MAAGSSLLNQEQLDLLPKELYWGSRELYQWEGFWYAADLLQGTLTLQSGYEARSDDVILASSMKTGSTWLKALCASIMGSQSKGDDSEENDELLVKNPHFIVKGLEYLVGRYNTTPDDLSAMPSPRLFHTHVPYSALPDSIKNSECKIVYIVRNPKDTLISSWHFFNKVFRQPNEEPYPLEKAYDDFCRGIHQFGPFFDHALQYWNKSLKNPEKILFLKYEDLKKDPEGEVTKLASFLGRPFQNKQQVEKVLWRSSLERLKNLEVNKDDSQPGLIMSSFFRRGVVGDWKNYLTEEMEQGLDVITRLKLEGSGLHFEI
ncbi:Sulfotransferase [Melia azedarach]|uniref:Sulfotransferase n=1 Tax=Melia azedarach TaxID=155640 RepID=A0ACC1YBS6_MELAZ|nr:Sulfotransferase [Melia azedarach]